MFTSALGHLEEITSRLPTIPMVFVGNHDPLVCELWERLVRIEGWHVQAFSSVEAFLSCPSEFGPSCLVLDASFLSLGGLELKRRITAERADVPVIFTTDCGDTAELVQAMKAGAAEFLVKPIDEVTLASALRRSIARSAAARGRESVLQSLQSHYSELTSREREVMALVVAGGPNKQVAAALGISEITVKAHRGRVMRKMRAGSLVDLVHMAVRLSLTNNPWDSSCHLDESSALRPRSATKFADRAPDDGRGLGPLLGNVPPR
ncbi:MAG TPA: LuxR C-terminal-related transcriptional regulator [Acetobacteraceae bacterium]|nr:LuxR C-terminal-related transcriptional regulator [Acetobacteraceae bacterium]